MWDVHMFPIWLLWICDMCQGGKVVGQFGILDAVKALIDIIQLGSTQKALFVPRAIEGQKSSVTVTKV